MITRHAAGIIPVYPGGAILLQLRDDRPDVPAANCWSTVGGHIEPGESPAAAAAREMEEETGRRPEMVIAAGHHDHLSGHTPGVTVRSHIFAIPARWSLDDLILGEGQRLDWFMPAEVPGLPLAPALAPAILGFLASDLHRSLAGEGPPAVPPLPGTLSQGVCALLGLRPGGLLAVEGISAGFVRRLADLPHGTRITASLGTEERLDAVLWRPRGEPIGPALAAWRQRLAPGGLVVVVSSGPTLAGVRLQAKDAGLLADEVLHLPGLPPALPLRSPAPR